jgi:hypothetical protein
LIWQKNALPLAGTGTIKFKHNNKLECLSLSVTSTLGKFGQIWSLPK